MRVDTSVMRGAPDRGFLAKSVAGAVDVTLTTDEAQHNTIEFQGAITASINVNFPLGAETGRVYRFRNTTTGAFTVNVRGSVGTGVTVTQGQRAIFVWTGADFVQWTGGI